MWRVEFFKIGKRDFTFIREMRVLNMPYIIRFFREPPRGRHGKQEKSGFHASPPPRTPWTLVLPWATPWESDSKP